MKLHDCLIASAFIMSSLALIFTLHLLQVEGVGEANPLLGRMDPYWMVIVHGIGWTVLFAVYWRLKKGEVKPSHILSYLAFSIIFVDFFWDLFMYWVFS